MLPLQTNTESYWTEKFQVTETDLEFVYNLFLEEETPLRTPDLIERLITRRIQHESRRMKKQFSDKSLFKPAEKYKVGDELSFPAFDFASGLVIESRTGDNPEYGEFTVLKVEFEDGTVREIASNLSTDHKLNQAPTEISPDEQPDPKKIYQKHKRTLTPIVVDSLRDDEDTVFIAGRWFLKSLLVKADTGVLNLSEAVLDLSEGGPLETLVIAEQIDFGQDANPILRGVSLDYALSQDARFDEVGPAGKVWWFLKRMEPKEILEPPAILRYLPIEYDANRITDDLLDLDIQINDELSMHEDYQDGDDDDAATIILTYPHWRMGTLPLTQDVDQLFPIAYRAPRIRITLVDAHGGREMEGWVVRNFGYVYGLGDFYQQHQLPVGTYITIRAEDNLSRLVVDYDGHKARQEWVRSAHIAEDRLKFQEDQQLVGARFDELTILSVDDPDVVDAFGAKYRHPNVNLPNLMVDLMRELAQFSPQGYVHAKTLYSAVNLLRRCPPAPIFATLNAHPSFENAGGSYWRLV